MHGTLHDRRRLPAVLLLLLLCGAPLRAHAQEFVCSPIEPGDTVSRLGRRLTGSARSIYSDAFQIRDPARQMFVPKSQYLRPLSPRWEACVARDAVRASIADAPVPASAPPRIATPESAITSAPLETTAASTSQPPGATHDARVVLATIGSAALATLLFYVSAGGLLRPRPAPVLLQRAGEQFVDAFARPLVDSSSATPPIRTRLRFVRRARRLDIGIAPGPGRRYPNLDDHRRNVEYDVRRVMRTLGAHVVPGGDLRASGPWVIVPITLADHEQTGGS